MQSSRRDVALGGSAWTGRWRRGFSILVLLIRLGGGDALASLGDGRDGIPIVERALLPVWGSSSDLHPSGREILARPKGARRPCKGKRACPTPTPTAPPTGTPTPAPTATLAPTATPTAITASAIDILEPPDGASLVEDRIRVEGRYEPASAAVAVVVNGLVAIANEGRFVVNEVPLEAGESPIEATLHIDGVPVVTDVVRVTSEARPPALELRAAPESGVAPLSVRFEWQVGTGVPIESLTLDLDGDGTIDHSTTDASGTLDHTYGAPGVFEAKAAVRHTSGAVHETAATIEVLDAGVIDTAIRESWNEMNAALAGGDVAAATRFMTPSAGSRYGPVFERLAANLPAIVASYGEMTRRSIGERVATFVVTRRIGDSTGVFFVSFEKGADGVWRLSSM